MSWSYSGNPSSSNLDAVRFLIGDTNTKDQQLQNEEINYLLASYPNPYLAGAYAAKAIAAKYARLVDKNVGDLRISYSQRQKSYQDLYEDLLNQSSFRTAVPYAGGISVADKTTDDLDQDAVQPTFYRDQFNYPVTNSNINPDPNQTGFQPMP